MHGRGADAPSLQKWPSSQLRHSVWPSSLWCLPGEHLVHVVEAFSRSVRQKKFDPLMVVPLSVFLLQWTGAITLLLSTSITSTMECSAYYTLAGIGLDVAYVAGIIGAHFPETPAHNGVAPPARPVETAWHHEPRRPRGAPCAAT